MPKRILKLASLKGSTIDNFSEFNNQLKNCYQKLKRLDKNSPDFFSKKMEIENRIKDILKKTIDSFETYTQNETNLHVKNTKTNLTKPITAMIKTTAVVAGVYNISPVNDFVNSYSTACASKLDYQMSKVLDTLDNQQQYNKEQQRRQRDEEEQRNNKDNSPSKINSPVFQALINEFSENGYISPSNSYVSECQKGADTDITSDLLAEAFTKVLSSMGGTIGNIDGMSASLGDINTELNNINSEIGNLSKANPQLSNLLKKNPLTSQIGPEIKPPWNTEENESK